ncbi:MULTISPECIES: hypothetical protein [Vibrio]|uniref:hypothetical protein n=1 Tax=Vibrio TaxID=662 RepID=UPI00209438DE|nr:hypothetical protein [Vibrio paracholerae]EGR4170143.1 hypothetical protein [Vibrio cholerae]EGR4230488.1 hypothetical protein [Vibrio cholerae]EGR4233120.1 hypothetical protein [Vibrio cholerae]ELJ8546009.1 hypothetical protein [Vibrio cholerae]ELJ8750051.1 hypothetical protein [Vibrio cholerae]
MNIKEAKLLFDAGAYKEAIICKTSPLMSTKQGFTLMLAGKKPSDSKFMTTQRSDDPKVFKKLETAVGEAYEIGFAKVSVELKDW